MNPFKGLNDADLAVVYDALCELVAGPGCVRHIHNADRGHPVYRMGAQGHEPKKPYADSPKHNALFRTGAAVHAACAARDPGFFEKHLPSGRGAPFASWEAFCESVVAG